MSIYDRVSQHEDWIDGINAFRIEATERILELYNIIDKLEAKIEKASKRKKSRSKKKSVPV